MHQHTDHPSAALPSALTSRIRALAAASEGLGQLHPELLELVYEERWFLLFVPETNGGTGLSLPQAVRLEEALSWADGSLGWVITLCAGAGWFSGFLPKEVRAAIFSDRKACLAGSGAPTGKAVYINGEYVVNGSWKYASGALHATAFTANCFVEQNGEVLRREDGSPLVRSFVFKKEEVEIKRSWDAMGMVATGSHSFDVLQQKIPEARCFIIEPEYAVLDHPVYQYPFLPFAEVTLAVNMSGMAVHFMDLCAVLFAEKIQSGHMAQAHAEIMSLALRNAQSGLMERRRVFYDALEVSWSICGGGEAIPMAVLEGVQKTSHELADYARQAVDELYPFCGLSAAYHSSEINRVWRDIHTAGQHSLFLRMKLDEGG